MKQKYLILDYETRSDADLRKVGAYEYSKHPSTQILCAAWRIGTKEELPTAEIKCWSPFLESTPKMGLELNHYFSSGEFLHVAHNALFEQVITNNVYYKNVTIPPERWICTAAMAASHALPRNLEGACAALKLPHQKDMEGRRLILKYCKPRKETLHNDNKWHNYKNDLLRLMEYCKKDVAAETDLFLALPELNEQERKVWELDQKINLRGFAVDRSLVTKILNLIEIETGNLHDETKEIAPVLTSVNQRDKVLKFLETKGLSLPDLQTKTVVDTLARKDIHPAAKRILEIRQAVSRTSTAKYQAFEIRSRSDGRIRDHSIYHQAGPGRWAGAGLQPQNLPRGNIKNTPFAAEMIRTYDLETLRLLYGDPMNLFSSCLRSMIVASPGMEYFCADYAAIEARVLFWLAEHENGLKAYRNNDDLYKKMASIIYGISIESVTKEQREIGKRAILGCGYGMGHKKFRLTGIMLGGIDVGEELAQKAVYAYREAHFPIPQLWSKYERAAIAAVQNPGKVFKINKIQWFVRGKFLYAQLPSKRRIAYPNPEVVYESTPWHEKVAKLYYYGVNGYTKKYEREGTYGGKLVENITQGCARDFLAEAMLRIDAAGYEIALHAHDENLSEKELGKGNLTEFNALMAVLPAWAEGCPIKSEGWTGLRYRK